MVMGDVVVGVDGSDQSLLAVRAAAFEARCRGVALHIVHVYDPVPDRDLRATAAVVGAASYTAPAETGTALLRTAHQHEVEERSEAQRHAEGRLRQWVASSGADLAGLEVQREALSSEHPSAALLRLSQGADLLVVGSRGLGGFAGVLMGSVSQQCVHHATCPVLVVRPQARTFERRRR
jgi:nucleotide-binding universal stress UspA family protein